MQQDNPQFSGTPEPYAASQQPVQDFRNLPNLQPSPLAHTPPVAVPYSSVNVPYAIPRYAQFHTRFFAWLIDGFLVGMVVGAFVILGSITSAIGASVLGADAAAIAGMLAFIIFLPLSLLAPLLYHLKFETGPAQGTLGKQWLGIRVVTLDGRTISKGQSLGRCVVRFLLSGAFVGLGYFIALFTERKQALHDLIANTIVVER
ncbi:MAG: RDD family protein [Bryobacterales bacterium]|nr:RDD family protein [Bryobacterales bacterium]